jgi:hypothetical protein
MKDTHNDNSEAAISVVVDIQVRTCDADMANISRFVRKLWGVILASIPPNLLVSLRTALQMLDLFHLETCFVDPRRWYQPGALQHLSSMHDCALLLPGKCYRVSPRRRGTVCVWGLCQLPLHDLDAGMETPSSVGSFLLPSFDSRRIAFITLFGMPNAGVEASSCLHNVQGVHAII